MWIIRAGRGAEYIDSFKENRIIAVGWTPVPSLASCTSKDSVLELFRKTFPELKPSKAMTAASQLHRFRNDFKVNDEVATYDSPRREYLIGRIAGDYKFNQSLLPELPHQRQVEWIGAVSRDTISVKTKNSLGAIQTLFRLGDSQADELRQLLNGKKPAVAEPEDEEVIAELSNQYEDLEGRSHELIKDKINRLDPYELQDLVAGLLRSMGYKTKVSPKGADGGVDIIASTDGLGFLNRVLVQVKHRDSQAPADSIRSLMGIMRSQDERGLFVSTGGFSKDARAEAARSPKPITLMDIDDLVSQLSSNYDLLDLDTKALLPLRRLYWPTSDDF